MQPKETTESNVLNQWSALNRLLFIYKAAGAALTVVCVLLTCLCMMMASRKPIVAMATGDDYFYFQGHRANVELNETGIKRFIEKYVKLSYQWSTLEPEKITQEIAPLVTDGFKAKEFSLLKQRKEKQFLGKAIRQDVSGLSIQVTKDATVAIFDVVLHVDGIPLIVPTQVSFELARGSTTEWNPLGLYINGETLHEGK